MSFPKSAVIKILGSGIIFIRNNSQKAERCQLEADHLHTLPYLLETESVGALRYYYEAFVPDYTYQVKGVLPPYYKEAWQEIEAFLATSDKGAK